MNGTLEANQNGNPKLFSSRPLLVFKHNPKAGGGSIKKLLRDMKDQTFHIRCLADCALYNRNFPCKEKKSCLIDQHISLSQLKDRNDTAVFVDEFDFLSNRVQKDAYVISSIREPCDHYISLWSYKYGGLYNSLQKKDKEWTEKAYGKHPPLFDSADDIYAFQYEWLRDSKIQGLIGRRHRESYGEKSALLDYPVDCWVYVDDYQATLYSCLRKYEAQGGVVNWTTPLMTELVQTLQEKLYPNRRVLDAHYHSKNDVNENPQQYHHAKCSKYFDNETARLVRFGSESIIYDIFGYDGCCQGRTHKSSLVLPPPPSTLANNVSGDLYMAEESIHSFSQDQTVFNSYYFFYGGIFLCIVSLVYVFKHRKWCSRRMSHQQYTTVHQTESM